MNGSARWNWISLNNAIHYGIAISLFILPCGELLKEANAESETGERITMSLNGVWKFCVPLEETESRYEFLQHGLREQKSYPQDAKDRNFGWIEPDFDDSVWWDITIPNSWNTQFEDLWSYEGTGWFRKTVTVPEAWRGKRIVFHSDCANYRTVLYVNGTKAGVHEGGYTAFSFPIHDYIQFGEINTFAISVDNQSLLERVPMERHDWWNHGGLYRPLRLEATDKVYVDDVIVVTDALSSPAQVSVDVSIVTEEEPASGWRAKAVITGTHGETEAEQSKTIVWDGSRSSMKFALPVQEAKLWSPEQPYLYLLRIDLFDRQNQRCDRWERRIGIRTITVDGTRFLINGKPYWIKGLNRYENYPDTGMTPNRKAMKRDVQLIKAMGGNAVRCHYTYSRESYEYLDEAGLFAVCEVPLYQWGRPGHSTKNTEAALAQLKEIVQTLRNHPSVLMWSVSNENRIRPREEGEEHRKLSDMVVAGNRQLVDLAHALDATRPVIEPSNRWPDDAIFEKTDINAVNVYLGASEPRVAALTELKAAMHAQMEKLREMHPGKPILVSEFGCWALHGFKADYYPGEQYQAELLHHLWEGFREESNWMGGFIWCFADSDTHRKLSSIVEMRCAYGVFDIHRRPKEAVRVMTGLWTRPQSQ